MKQFLRYTVGGILLSQFVWNVYTIAFLGLNINWLFVGLGFAGGFHLWALDRNLTLRREFRNLFK